MVTACPEIVTKMTLVVTKLPVNALEIVALGLVSRFTGHARAVQLNRVGW